MKKIIVSVSNDLTTDQRVDKVCRTLHNAGYDVILIGRKQKNSQPIKRSYRTKRIRLFFNTGPFFYAALNLNLFFLLFFSKKDILLANDMDTLLPNYLVAKLQKKKIVFDSHELFSEVPELVHRPLIRKIWSNLENWILPQLQNTYTVCDSIANYYTKKYQTNFKVIRNLPIHQKKTLTGSFPFDTKENIILYQGALNVGRGLELIIETMPLLSDCTLVVVGSGDIVKQLKDLVAEKNAGNCIKFLGKVTPNYLQTITPLATLGISIEEDFGLNYRFALPNKIFDYLQAEIPILVSDLPEMKKIVTDYKVGEVVKNRNPKNLAKQIEALLKKDYSKELKKAKKALIWEYQERELLAIFETNN